MQLRVLMETSLQIDLVAVKKIKQYEKQNGGILLW